MDATALAKASSEHELILKMMELRFGDLYWWFGIIFPLFLASFLFTSGAYIYVYMVSHALSAKIDAVAESINTIMNNHIKHLEARLKKVEGEDQ